MMIGFGFDRNVGQALAWPRQRCGGWRHAPEPGGRIGPGRREAMPQSDGDMEAKV
jgi:hypothetical protein